MDMRTDRTKDRRGATTSGGRKPLPLKFPFPYCDTPEMRVLDLTADGINCIPVLGLTRLGRGGRPTTDCEHVHEECIEISYCQRGELVFESGGMEYSLRPGNVFLSRPDEPHRLKGYPKGTVMYWLFFRMLRDGYPMLSLPAREASYLKSALSGMTRRLFSGGDRVRMAFQRLFAVYDREARHTPRRTLMMRTAVVDLLLAILDASIAVEELPMDSRVKQTIEAIRADPVQSFTIDDLAGRTALSPSNLILRFKQLVGLPPQAFRNACRMEKAKRELAGGTKSVTSIALSLGYSSAQNFATQFRLATGKTPREWRKGTV